MVGVIGGAALGQSKRPMTPEEIVALNRASDVQLASDARRIVFVLTGWDREKDRFNADLWMTSDARETVRLTTHEKRDDHPRWSPDGRRIAFLSERGDADAGAQIYLLNSLVGGEPQQLTRHPVPVQRFEWSPDGRFIAFLAAAPVPKPKTKPPVVIDEEDRPHQLWIVETATGQIKQLTTGKRHIVAFNWAPDGSRIVLTARATSRLLDSPTTEVYVISAKLEDAPADTASARQITTGNGAEAEPRFSPNGLWISYLAKADGDPQTGPDRIHLVPANGGGAPLVLPRNFDGYIRGYQWVFDSQRIVFNAGLGVNEQIHAVNVGDRTAQALTRSDGVNPSFSISPDGMTIAFVHENPRIPSEIGYLSARIMVPVFLTTLNPQSESLALGQVEAIRWRSNDGTEVEGLLVYPVGYETGRRYPLVTYLHGGPEGAYTKGYQASWSAFPQVYAGRGFAVFMPNFRGSSNYGARFAQANAKLAGKVDAEDVISGIDYLIKQGIADEAKLGVAGWSYGGYLSAWLIGQTTRFRCAAYGAGLSNAVSYWGTADIVAQRERLHGGTPWEAKKLYEEQSPLTYFPRVKTPTLIFHGEKDERVPLSQSQESYRSLRRLGVDVQMVVYPDQGHGLLVPSYQIDKMKRELGWMEKYLQPVDAGR